MTLLVRCQVIFTNTVGYLRPFQLDCLFNVPTPLNFLKNLNVDKHITIHMFKSPLNLNYWFSEISKFSKVYYI
jgi:hypothetical protein